MSSNLDSVIAEMSFEDFVKRCAPIAAPFTGGISFDSEQSFVPSDHHEKCLEEAKEEYDELSRLSVAEALRVCGEKYDKAYHDAVEYYERREKEMRVLKKKYEDMLGKVEDWVPPTPQHVGVKEYMIRQLKESIGNCDFASLEKSKPEKLSAERALYMELDDLARKIEYHRE